MIFDGRFLKAARQKANLTQAQLGEKVGVTGVAIMRYENNQRKPNKEMFDKLVSALDIAPCTLAIGVTQEEWDAINPDMKELFEFGEPENISEKQPVISHFIDDLTTKEIRIFNELTSYYEMLNTEGMKEAAKRIEEMTRLEEYKRIKPISDQDGKSMEIPTDKVKPADAPF